MMGLSAKPLGTCLPKLCMQASFTKYHHWSPEDPVVHELYEKIAQYWAPGGAEDGQEDTEQVVEEPSAIADGFAGPDDGDEELAAEYDGYEDLLLASDLGLTEEAVVNEEPQASLHTGADG